MADTPSDTSTQSTAVEEAPPSFWRVDRLLLSLTAAVMAPALALLAIYPSHSPIVLLLVEAAMFALAAHPVWSAPWIEKSLTRRLAALVVLALLLSGYAKAIWPVPPPPKLHFVNKTLSHINSGPNTQILVIISYVNDGEKAQIRASSVWLMGNKTQDDTAAIKQARASADGQKLTTDETGQSYDDGSQEPQNYTIAGPVLTPKQYADFLAGHDKFYFSGYIEAKNAGGETPLKFCGFTEGSTAVFECPAEQKG